MCPMYVVLTNPPEENVRIEKSPTDSEGHVNGVQILQEEPGLVASITDNSSD